MMEDKIEKFGDSVLQHGKINNRIYLMKLATNDAHNIVPELDKLAAKNKYAKIFAKIPAQTLPAFTAGNYLVEGFIPRFFSNKTDCFFVSKFIDESRKVIPESELKLFGELMLTTIKSTRLKYKHSLQFKLEKLSAVDAKAISAIFKKVFKTYPFPIHDPEYILETITRDKTRYFGIKDGTKLIGVSSAEIDILNKNAEMTDFAVLPEYRGHGLAFRLLTMMELEMKLINIKNVYTIARLKEPGICKTFLKSGYKFSGTLLNNTNISGNIESMNLFYKHL
ncbi:MAG: putative beta-lysine N-acetyltransferase [Prolixibacteraceae bacterium]|nr:putative beta-lysine N-acetyltransferase [Prolixibacteraceae bacterium]